MYPSKRSLVSIGVIVITLIAATADAGLFRRCRKHRSGCGYPGSTVQQQAATLRNCTADTICLMYPYADHTTYCSYYAAVCDGAGGVTRPSSWDDSCGQPTGSCGNCPSSGCKTRNYAREKTCDDQLIGNDLAKQGMLGDKPQPADLTKLDPSAKPDKKEGTLVKVNSAAGILIVCQLWEVKVDPSMHVPKLPHPVRKCFIGHEVDAAPTAEMEMIKDIDRTWDLHVCCLKFKGKTYSVISHHLTR
ncbi:MAG: hypothetical protein ACR2FY_06055 [Pirellulaceae bacterium]